jgi:hypothetical protein
MTQAWGNRLHAGMMVGNVHSFAYNTLITMPVHQDLVTPVQAGDLAGFERKRSRLRCI